MKDGKFETQAEIYQALLDGKKIRHSDWPHHEYIYLKDGRTVSHNEGEFNQPFSNYKAWEFYQEPKQKIKIVAHIYNPSGAVNLSIENSNSCQYRENNKQHWKRLSLSFDAEVL